MGYFSNGCEGEGFYDIHCANCVHDAPPDAEKQCAVWMLHLAYNSEQNRHEVIAEGHAKGLHGPTLKHLLRWLIHDDTSGQSCAMFSPRGDVRITDAGDAWCESFRHHQRMTERNAGAPCLLCLAESALLPELTHA